MPASKPMTPEQWEKWGGARGDGPARLKPALDPRTADGEKAWAKWSELPRPVSKPAPLWAKGVLLNEVVYQVLTAAELMRLRVDADEATVRVFGDSADVRRSQAFEENYELEKAIHMLVLATRDASDPRFPVFTSARDIRESLTDDEIGVMLVAYANHRRDCGPFLSELTDAECEAWIEVLAKAGSRVPLARCSGEALTDLVMYLVSRLRPDFATASSSSGLPPEESSTPTPSGESTSVAT